MKKEQKKPKKKREPRRVGRDERPVQ
jgi:hypothetical protein